jgi:hypothetical protein
MHCYDPARLPRTLFADCGNIFPLFSRLFNGNVMGARFYLPAFSLLFAGVRAKRAAS